MDKAIEAALRKSGVHGNLTMFGIEAAAALRAIADDPEALNALFPATAKTEPDFIYRARAYYLKLADALSSTGGEQGK